MKFSKSLSSVTEETIPEWKDKFLPYKDLKKQLNLMYPNEDTDKAADGAGAAPVKKRRRLEEEGAAVAKEVIDFVTVLLLKRNFVRNLEEEMEKFNLFIEDKEEDFVIKWKELQDRVGKAKNSNEELMRVGREIVDFHGEMVLLENYSALNYTGLLKILKKYDKRSGELIRLAFIHKIMQQPFFTTQVLNQLVKECETMLDQLFSNNESPDSRETTSARSNGVDYNVLMESTEQQLRFRGELSENENTDSMYAKLTRSALRALKEIRSGSSTVNMFSLPPFPINAM